MGVRHLQLTLHQANMPKLAQPLRVALSGTAATPSIDLTLAWVGQVRTLNRIDQALEYIQTRSEAHPG